MAKQTTRYKLTDAWTQVASAGQVAYLQNPRDWQVYYAYGATAPAVGSAGHVLDRNEELSESSLPAHLWVRAIGGEAVIIASTGGTAGASAAFTTTAVDLTGTWTQIAAAGQNVHLDGIGGPPIRWAYSSAAPASDLDGHIMAVANEYRDTVADQNIWARSNNAGQNGATSRIVVTKG